MSFRFAATSGLALAAALVLSNAAGAQSFFSYYEMSPRQIVGMLADDGYELRGPMWRRGDVYICDVTSVSGRGARLIVDAHDGHVLQRFASVPRARNSDEEGSLRPPRDVGFGSNRDAEQDERAAPRRSQLATGDAPSPQSRDFGDDSALSPKPPAILSAPDEATSPRPKHSATKKHRAPSVAKVSPDAAPTPEAAKPTAAPTPSMAAVAPSSAAEERKPAEAAVKPAPIEATKPAAEIAPAPTPSPAPVQTKIETEKRTASEADAAPVAQKPKAEPARKKINDLPVGTLE